MHPAVRKIPNPRRIDELDTKTVPTFIKSNPWVISESELSSYASCLKDPINESSGSYKVYRENKKPLGYKPMEYQLWRNGEISNILDSMNLRVSPRFINLDPLQISMRIN